MKWHSCAKGWFCSCETTCEMGVWLRKLEFLSFEDFAAAKFRGGCEMELMCQEGVSQRGVWGCKIISQPWGDFAAASWGCEIILQPRAIFAGALFGLRNLVNHEYFLAFELLLIPRDLPSISLQFLLN